jgi:hypothetical protein
MSTEQLLTEAVRGIALAGKNPVEQLKALKNGAASLAIPIRHGFIEQADVYDRLIDEADNVGLLTNVGHEVVESAIAKGIEDGLSNILPDEQRPRTTTKPNGPFVSAPPPSTNATELNTMRFDPIKYVVPGYFVEGLTLLAGKPKIGKSWFLLHTAIAVARGGFTLGDIHCIEGDVLYCALEDNLRRLQSRMTKLLGTQGWPKRLWFQTEMRRLVDGGLDFIKSWIEKAEHPRLVIIDTLAMVKTPKAKVQTLYEADYDSVVELRRLASQHHIAIVLVHHQRKAEADDAFDTVSATLGLTGAVDTVLVLRRDTRGSYVLHGKGRDLTEIEKAMTFNADTCVWTILGDAGTVRITAERNTILAVLADADSNPLGPNEIATTTGMKSGNVRRLLGKMKTEGLVTCPRYGKYTRVQERPTVIAY